LQIQYVSYPGDESRWITNDLNDYRGVSLTADSHTIATVQRKVSFDIWVAPVAELDRAKPITSGGRSADATWSHDGKVMYDERGGRGEKSVWAMDADGGDSRQLTVNVRRENRCPRVTPDGRHIVFISEDSSPHLWRMDIDGNNPVQLTNSAHDLLQVGDPEFTVDGKWVVYGKWGPEWGIWKVPIEGGQPVQVNHTPYAAFPAASPDGKMLAYTFVDESKSQVAVMPLDGGGAEKHFDIVTEALRWSPDGRSLLYVNTDSGVSNIWSQPVAGGLPTQLTHFTSNLIDSFDLSRDGKQIVMTRGPFSRDVVLIRDVTP
jgi:Tol biopolymer transport system component